MMATTRVGWTASCSRLRGRGWCLLLTLALLAGLALLVPNAAAAGEAVVIAGGGEQEPAHGVPATEAYFTKIFDVVPDTDGQIRFGAQAYSGYDNEFSIPSSSGALSILSDTPADRYARGPDGSLYYLRGSHVFHETSESVSLVATDGNFTGDIAVDGSGNVFVGRWLGDHIDGPCPKSDSSTNRTEEIVRVSPDGQLDVIARSCLWVHGESLPDGYGMVGEVAGIAARGSEVYALLYETQGSTRIYDLTSSIPKVIFESLLGGAGDLEIDSKGTLFLSRADIYKVVPATGVVTKLWTAENTEGRFAVGGVGLSCDGSLLFVQSGGVNSPAYIARLDSVAAAGSCSPDSIPGPPSIADPDPTDPLMKRGLLLPSEGVTYEFGWAKASGATKPTTSIQDVSTSAVAPRVSFKETTPNDNWTLFWRTVDGDGTKTKWRVLERLLTPKKPTLIALGDSVTSGHHKDGRTDAAECYDPGYSYGQTAYDRMQKKLPDKWQGGGYSNFARSGFSTDQVLSGGDDACGSTYNGSSPIDDAVRRLSSRSSSWNRVVITAGINNTNWVPVLEKIALSLTSSSSEEHCHAELSEWNGWTDPVASNITTDAAEISTELATADPSARLSWLSYFNIAGTGPAPATCEGPIDDAMDALHGTIQLGLDDGTYEWVDTDSRLRMNSSLIQKFYVNPGTPGWPHPNQDGAREIGDLIPVK